MKFSVRPDESCASMTLWAAVALAASFLAGCTHSPTYHVYGRSLIRTDAPSEVIAEAIRSTHEALGAWAKTAEGTQRDASFREGVHTWKRVDGNGLPTRIARSETRFDDSEGRSVTIERLSVDDQYTLLFVFSEKLGDSLGVINCLTRSLEACGVRSKFAPASHSATEEAYEQRGKTR